MRQASPISTQHLIILRLIFLATFVPSTVANLNLLSNWPISTKRYFSSAFALSRWKRKFENFPNFPIPSEAKAVDVGTFEVYREVPLCQLNQGAFFTSLIIPLSEVQQTRSLCRQIWSQFVCHKTLQKMCFLSIQGYIFQVVHVVVDDRLKTRRAEEEQWWEKKRIKRQNSEKRNGKRLKRYKE